MLLRCSIALDCLERALPPIDQDQKLALLHAPFRGTTLFGGELAKLQEANTKCAVTFTVFPRPTAPLHLTLHVLTRVVVRVLEMIRRASENQAAEAGDRAGPRQPPPLRDLANLRIARKL